MVQPLKHLAVRRSDLFFMVIADLHIEEGWNERREFKGIPELCDSIVKNNKIIMPLRVRRDKDGKIFVVDGERRHRAVTYGIENNLIPADFPIPITVDSSKDVGERLITQLESNTGIPFTLLEKARLYQRIRATGIDAPTIAKRSQTSKQAVYTALSLVDLGSPYLLSLVEENKISASFAAEIIAAHKANHAAQDAAATDALHNAAQAGRTSATPKDIAKPEPSQPSQSGQSSQQDQSNTNPSDEKTGQEGMSAGALTEEDDEPPTTVVTPHKDKVNPPPNPGAYDSIINAPSTNRDGSSANSGPTEFTKPDKQLEKLDSILEKFEFSGSDHLEDTHNERFQTAEIVIEYLRGTTTADVLKKWLNCTEKK